MLPGVHEDVQLQAVHNVDDNASTTTTQIPEPLGLTHRAAVDGDLVIVQKETEDKSSPMIDASLEDRSSGAVSPVESTSRTSDSMVLDQGSETPPASALPSVLRSADTASQASTASMPPSASSTTTYSSALERGQSRRRSTLDARAANRFSGFLSTFLHRRPDRETIPSPSTQPNMVPGDDASPVPEKLTTSRASSPMPPPRPVTPPPALPPPTLQELGLSLTAITSTLTPSHFNTPPASGTFLAPHYLLLCHAQGLDVLPLVSPPAPQPYALVRRVSFKSVVVMEERGVLVAIAGRREGVRVYALAEVKKAVEWRIDVEVRRERERQRREEAKKGISGGVDKVFAELRASEENSKDKEKETKARLPSPPSSPSATPKAKRRKSLSRVGHDAPPAMTSGPRTPTARKAKSSPREAPQPLREIEELPPAYVGHSPTHRLHNQSSTISVSQTRARSDSVTNVLAGSTARRRRNTVTSREGDEKGDWLEEHGSSEDEAINLATAGSSGSAALDERTSSMAAGSSGSGPTIVQAVATLEVPNVEGGRSQTATVSLNRRNRPAHLDLTRVNPSPSAVAVPPPSPTPTLFSLRQALSTIDPAADDPRSATPDAEEDEDGAPMTEPISFAQALLESRLPNLPPPGTRRPQQPILIGASQVATPDDEPASPRDSMASESASLMTRGSQRASRRRRRWSVLGGMSPPEPSSGAATVATPARRETAAAPALMRGRTTLARSQSQSLAASQARLAPRLSASPARTPQSANTPSTAVPPTTPNSRRFLPRIITQAFQARRSEDNSSPSRHVSAEITKRPSGSNLVQPPPPPPKLEYVKLPGTKGAVMIKAVETAKKSFLAILCGDAGEKVELFAGTYRTTLGLSRTFILPDSPRSLELQLQGDDLVEVFLVFSQNVFGLEPATVRVREVRVGRAERRAARRRNRENRVEEQVGSEADAIPLGEEETSVSVSVGVSLQSTEPVDEVAVASASISRQNSDGNITPAEPSGPTTTVTNPEDVAILATANMGPYTTFQQLSFAPQFPLATISDECIIPPSYPSFLDYRAEYETEENGTSSADLATIQFSPPGLPAPTTAPPSKWFYRDPKGVVQGPWKSSLMQSWYKDGLLPPDLPVRREEDSDYVLLKDLRLQSVDPTHPFRPPPPPFNTPIPLSLDPVKPLLAPISLLSQPRQYGPPSLFFCSRSGHSTAIVDARGRSVLKGRVMWTQDEEDELMQVTGKLGDVRRLETFDVKGRAVLVGVRQGGMEVLDVGDALMKPGDESRTLLPHFHPPPAGTNRRGSYIWRIGSPITALPTGPVGSLPPKTLHPPAKKSSIGLGRSPGRTDFPSIGNEDLEGRMQDELLFLGRLEDNMYLCERNTNSFRILRLCPYPT